MGFVGSVTPFDAMTDEPLGKGLNAETEDEKNTVTLESLNKLLEKSFKMEKNAKNYRLRMKRLFANYHTLLIEKKIKWTTRKIKKLASCIFSRPYILSRYVNV